MLTVREAMKIAADLKLGHDLTNDEKFELVRICCSHTPYFCFWSRFLLLLIVSVSHTLFDLFLLAFKKI